jgi:hypothetical protein
MRSFMTFVMFLSFLMAGVTVACGWFGLIDLVETLVLTGSFVGMAFLIDWEIHNFECMD